GRLAVRNACVISRAARSWRWTRSAGGVRAVTSLRYAMKWDLSSRGLELSKRPNLHLEDKFILTGAKHVTHGAGYGVRPQLPCVGGGGRVPLVELRGHCSRLDEGDLHPRVAHLQI